MRRHNGIPDLESWAQSDPLFTMSGDFRPTRSLLRPFLGTVGCLTTPNFSVDGGPGYVGVDAKSTNSSKYRKFFLVVLDFKARICLSSGSGMNVRVYTVRYRRQDFGPRRGKPRTCGRRVESLHKRQVAMAVNDIYRLQLHYEGRQQGASTGLYYKETTLSTANGLANRSLVLSFIFVVSFALRDILSDDWELSAIQSSKVFDEPDPTAQDAPTTQGGTRTGSPLPADNAILLQLFQTTFPRTSDGRMFMPGISEADTIVGKLNQTFIDTQLSTLVTALANPISESGGTGQWTPGVISAKVRDAAPPTKNWAAAFAPIIGVQGWPVIARQVRRRTKVFGYNRS